MTRAEKETQRSKMMWTALWAIIAVMLLITALVFFNKPVADLGFIAGSFFAALAGVNGASMFSTPAVGASDDSVLTNTPPVQESQDATKP